MLHVSCSGGHVNIVQFLLAAYNDQKTVLLNTYDDLPANLLNFEGFTPLMLAANRGNHSAVKKIGELTVFVAAVALDKISSHILVNSCKMQC